MRGTAQGQRKPTRLGSRTKATHMAREHERFRALLEMAIDHREQELDYVRAVMEDGEYWTPRSMGIHLDHWEMAELEALLARKARYHHLIPQDVDIYSLPRNCYHWSYFNVETATCMMQKSIERLPGYCYEARRLDRYTRASQPDRGGRLDRQ